MTVVISYVIYILSIMFWKFLFLTSLVIHDLVVLKEEPVSKQMLPSTFKQSCYLEIAYRMSVQEFVLGTLTIVLRHLFIGSIYSSRRNKCYSGPDSLHFSFFGRGELVGLGGLNSGLCACKSGALPLEPHLQSILLWLFWRWYFMNYLPLLALNCDPPDLSLPSS
jgi:hypothetical protein